MKILNRISSLTILLVFSSQVLFANDHIHIPVVLPLNEKNEELLEETVAPPPPPALIDLNDEKKKPVSSSSKYESLGLFVFNLVMFTTGIAVVKSLPGKKVN